MGEIRQILREKKKILFVFQMKNDENIRSCSSEKTLPRQREGVKKN
jgi:hypothetical protein